MECLGDRFPSHCYVFCSWQWLPVITLMAHLFNTSIQGDTWDGEGPLFCFSGVCLTSCRVLLPVNKVPCGVFYCPFTCLFNKYVVATPENLSLALGSGMNSRSKALLWWSSFSCREEDRQKGAAQNTGWTYTLNANTEHQDEDWESC